MSILGDFAANLGFGTSSHTKDAEADLQAARDEYNKLAVPDLVQEHAQYSTANDQGPSAMSGISTNPENTQNQEYQMSALKNLAANGGHNAASDANLARIQQQEDANEAGQRGAILQNEQARGVGGTGAGLLAQLVSSQGATNRQATRDSDVAGQEAGTALQAGEGAASIGSNLENQQFGEGASKAAATDAINRFNAGNRTGVSEVNANTNNAAQQYNTGIQEQGFQNRAQKAGGLSGIDMGTVNFNQHQADIGAQQAGNLLSGGVNIGTAFASGKKSNSGGGSGSGGAAHGGRVPGMPNVPGDSPMNDTVPVETSPGEVVVPRTIAKGGNALEIAHFVKNPPQIKMGGGAAANNNNKEAMLAALKNIRHRRAG